MQKIYVYNKMENFNLYKCDFCTFETKSFDALTNHTRQHIKKSKNDYLFNCELNDLEHYKCRKCCFEVDMKIILHQHIKEAHGPIKQEFNNREYTLKSFICRTCSFETYSILVFAGHGCKPKKKKLKSNGPKRFECGHCGYRTWQQWFLKNHMRNHHLNVEVVKLLKCEHCSFQTNWRDSLKRHVEVKHCNSSRWFKCDHCSRKTKTMSALRVHVFKKHTSKEDQLWFECEHCPYKVMEKWRLEGHIIEKHASSKDYYFRCDHCSFRTERKQSLQRHVQGQHYEAFMKTTMCRSTLCQKTFCSP